MCYGLLKLKITLLQGCSANFLMYLVRGWHCLCRKENTIILMLSPLISILYSYIPMIYCYRLIYLVMFSRLFLIACSATPLFADLIGNKEAQNLMYEQSRQNLFYSVRTEKHELKIKNEKKKKKKTFHFVMCCKFWPTKRI